MQMNACMSLLFCHIHSYHVCQQDHGALNSFEFIILSIYMPKSYYINCHLCIFLL